MPQATAVKLAQLGEELFPTVWGNVGIADKREGAEGKLPFAEQTSWNGLMDEKQDIAVRHLKKTKRYEMQKFRVVRLQIEVQNRAGSGHRQTA